MKIAHCYTGCSRTESAKKTLITHLFEVQIVHGHRFWYQSKARSRLRIGFIIKFFATSQSAFVERVSHVEAKYYVVRVTFTSNIYTVR